MSSSHPDFSPKIVRQSRQELVLSCSPDTVGNVGCGVVITLVGATILAVYAFSTILTVLLIATLVGFYVPILGWIFGIFLGWGLVLEPFRWLLRLVLTLRYTYPITSVCRFNRPLRTITLKQQTRAHTVTSEFSFDEIERIDLYRYQGLSASAYEIELLIRPQRSLQVSLVRLRLRPEAALVVTETHASELAKDFEIDPTAQAKPPTVRVLRPTWWKLFTSASPRCRWEYTPIPWWFSVMMGDRHTIADAGSEAPKMQRIQRQIKQLINLP